MAGLSFGGGGVFYLLELIAMPFFVLKQLISVIQLLSAMRNIAVKDMTDRLKA